MLIICTAIFAWILSSKCGIQWTGAPAAYLIALMADFALIAILILQLTDKSK